MGLDTSSPGPLVRSHTMPMNKSPHVRACWLGRTPYREAWAYTAELVSSLRDGDVTDTFSCRTPARLHDG